MTGFGKGEAKNKRAKIYIEIKSLNHRYFDMINRLPLGFLIYEDKIKTSAQRHVNRGRLSLSLEYEDLDKKGNGAQVNMITAREYRDMLIKVKKSLGLSGEVTVQQLAAMPGVVTYAPVSQRAKTEHLWPLIKKALDEAIKQLVLSKKQEGKCLRQHLLSLNKKINISLNIIKRCSTELKKSYKNKLAKKIRHVAGTSRIIDKERLEEEAAIFIRNSDITEEICRIDTHLKAFKKAAASHKAVGRQLDFIAQEISREANTIGAKANNFRISKEIIKTKSLVEKIREQTQNVE